MNTKPLARLSRIAFYTDMTRVDAPVIPLGFMIEAVVPARARWLGLIGRSSLTRLEQDAVRLDSWKGLEKPFDLLLQLFEIAWDAEAGVGGSAAARKYLGSALSVTNVDQPELAHLLKAGDKDEWATARLELLKHLEDFDCDLVPPPTLLTPIIAFQPRAPVPIGDIDSRQRQGELKAA